MAGAETIKPYSMDDVYKALDDWRAIKAQRVEKERVRDAKKIEMESFQRDADTLLQQEQRLEATFRKILESMKGGK